MRLGVQLTFLTGYPLHVHAGPFTQRTTRPCRLTVDSIAARVWPGGLQRVAGRVCLTHIEQTLEQRRGIRSEFTTAGFTWSGSDPVDHLWYRSPGQRAGPAAGDCLASAFGKFRTIPPHHHTKFTESNGFPGRRAGTRLEKGSLRRTMADRGGRRS